jgi:hypothetical protein
VTTQTRTSKASDYKDAIHAAFQFGFAVTGELIGKLRVRGSRKKANDFIETLQLEESPPATGNRAIASCVFVYFVGRSLHRADAAV